MTEEERKTDARAAYNALMKFYPLTLDNLDGEEWCPISGYEGYQVSTFGRVKSFKHGTIKILKPMLTSFGYLQVTLCLGNKRIAKFVHRLVALAFIPNPNDKPQVNHKDTNKLNNSIENLEWATAKENTRHAVETGLKKQGEKCAEAKLTNEQAVYIRENPSKLTIVDLAKTFNVTPQTISCVQRGITYKTAGGNVRAKQAFGEYWRVPDKTRDKIRAEWSTGHYTYTALAKKYAVDRCTIKNIVTEK